MSAINGFSSQISSLSLNTQVAKGSSKKGFEPLTITIDPKDLNIPSSKNAPPTIRVSSKDVEIQIFKKFGFDVKNQNDLAALKQRLGGKDPFAHVDSDPNGYTAKLENGKYVIKTSIETKLLKELKGVAAEAKSQSPVGNIKAGDNPNNVEAAKSGGDLARQRAAIEKKLPPRIPGHVPGLPPGDLKNAVEKFQKVEKMADELGQVARQALEQPGALDALLDEAQGALDLIGIVDPTPLSDGASAVISLAREQYGYAALSMVAAVLPYAGDAVKLAKLPKLVKSAEHAVELAAAAPRLTEKTVEKLQALKKVLDDVPLENVPKATREAVEGLSKKVDTAIDTSKVAPRTVKEVSDLAQQVKTTRINKRYDEIATQGHAVQRHGEAVTERQLDDRAMHGKDPITGTTDDAFRKNADGTPKPHKSGKDATKFTTKESLVKAEDYVRKSKSYEDAVKEAEATGNDYIVVKDIKLEDVYGSTSYKDQVFGKTRLGSQNHPTGSVKTDFTDGTINAKFQKNSNGKWNLDTMYPEPK